MKKLYLEYFHIPKHSKVTEKVFFTRITMSIIIIIVCMISMSFAAYGYFAHGVYTHENCIVSANYSLDIINITDGDVDVDEPLQINKTTTFKVTVSDITTSSVGYLKISVISDFKNHDGSPIIQTFYTEPIWREDDTENNKVKSREITVTVPDGKSIKIAFTDEWGSYSGIPIANNLIGEADIKYDTTLTEPNVNTDLQD